MDNTILVTLSAQNALLRQMEVAANNMANVTTTGFKADNILFEPISKKPASIVENPTTVKFVRDYTIARDFRPGALMRTDNSLDVALTGEGFFGVNSASETATELGMPLGIAIVGSIGAAIYRRHMLEALPAGLPPDQAAAAADTLGGAVGVAAALTDTGTAQAVLSARMPRSRRRCMSTHSSAPQSCSSPR